MRYDVHKSLHVHVSLTLWFCCLRVPAGDSELGAEGGQDLHRQPDFVHPEDESKSALLLFEHFLFQRLPPES